MLYLDIPTISEIKTLFSIRSEACLSVYLPTTPQTQHIGATKITFANLGKEGLAQLDAAGFDKRKRAAIAEQLDDLAADDEFWTFQAHSLAVLVTPDSLRTYRLPNQIEATVQVSDRYHLQPLLRTITFPNRAFVIALAENGWRLIEVSADLPAQEINVRGVAKDAASATGRASVNDRSPSGRIHGSKGQNVLLRQYARQIDTALRSVLAGREEPLIVAATEPLLSIWRSVNTYPGLVEHAITTSPGELTAAALADAARPILDEVYAADIAAFATLYDQRQQQGRAISDIAQTARAATFGAIDTLLIDIDEVVHGTIDETTGGITFADGPSADTYGVIDEIAGRALSSGAKVLGVRKADIPSEASLAAILRYGI